MDFNVNIDLVRSQKLILTPQLKQAIDLLSMNSQELFEYVEEQLEENPVLEAYDAEGRWDDEDMEEAFFFEWDDVNYDTENGENGVAADDEEAGGTTERKIYKLSLKEHLHFQLCTSKLPKYLYPLAEYMINSINENGFIDIDLDGAACIFGASREDAESVLELLQSFDPPGICARNLRECLIIQLKAMNSDSEHIVKIIRDYLDELARGDFDLISRELDISTEKVKAAFDLLKNLEPKPARAYYKNDGARFIIPDIIIKREYEGFAVYLNEDAIPLVGINKFYERMAHGDLSAETRKFIQNRLDSATRLIDCIEKRKEVLKKLAHSLVLRQQEFFEKGKEYLKPLDIETVAADIEVHESILSRALSGKYIQCPWGIFEARYFFG